MEDPTPKEEEVGKVHMVAVLGVGGVGKTSLIMRFVHGHFSPDWYDISIAEEKYRSKPMIVDGWLCYLDILDSFPGNDEFWLRRNEMIQSATGFLLVYSISHRESFDELEGLREAIRIRKEDEVPMVLVGNKCDMESVRQVSVAEGDRLAKALGCAFLEKSAKDRINVEECFHQLVRKVRRAETAIKGKAEEKKRREQERRNAKNCLLS